MEIFGVLTNLSKKNISNNKKRNQKQNRLDLILSIKYCQIETIKIFKQKINKVNKNKNNNNKYNKNSNYKKIFIRYTKISLNKIPSNQTTKTKKIQKHQI